MKRIILMLTVASMLMTTVASAAVVERIDPDYSTGIITVTGKNTVGDKENLLVVLNPGKSISDFNGTNGLEVFAQVKQTTSNDAGVFTFSYNMNEAVASTYNANNKLYTMNVSADGESTDSKTFYWYNDVQSIYNAITPNMGNTAINTTAVSNISTELDNYPDALAISFKLYNDLVSAGKQDDVSEIVSLHAVPVDFKALQKVFVGAVALETINNTTGNDKEDKALAIINTYNVELEMTDFAGFTALGENREEAVGIILHNGPYATISDFNTNVKNAMVLVELTNAGGTTGVQNVLNKYSAMFDLTKFNLADTNRTETSKKILTAGQNGLITSIAYVQGILNNPVKITGGGGGPAGPSAPVYSDDGVKLPSISDTDYNENNVVPSVSSTGFEDLATVEWAREAIEELVKLKIVNGMSATSFEPGSYVTRGQFSKMVCGAFGISPKVSSLSFNDVGTDTWYNGYVSALFELGAINGMSDEYFGANDQISREDIAVIIYRLADKLSYDMFGEGKSSFADNDAISTYAEEAVSALSGAKIINGYEDSTFKPQGSATRAETANLIYKVYELLQEVDA